MQISTENMQTCEWNCHGNTALTLPWREFRHHQSSFNAWTIQLFWSLNPPLTAESSTCVPRIILDYYIQHIFWWMNDQVKPDEKMEMSNSNISLVNDMKKIPNQNHRNPDQNHSAVFIIGIYVEVRPALWLLWSVHNYMDSHLTRLGITDHSVSMSDSWLQYNMTQDLYIDNSGVGQHGLTCGMPALPPPPPLTPFTPAPTRTH